MASRKLASFGRRSDFKKEYTIQDYKTDFYIPSSKTIIEVKQLGGDFDNITFSENNTTPLKKNQK